MIPEASIQQAYGVPPLANEPGTLTGNAALLAQFWEQQYVRVGTSPASFDVTQYTASSGGIAVNPKLLDQGLVIEIDARDFDIYVRFRGDAGSASTTPQNGRRISHSAGQPTTFWLPGQSFRYMDVVGTGSTGVTFRRISEARIRG